jgi:hypothetical protein
MIKILNFVLFVTFVVKNYFCFYEEHGHGGQT